MNHRTAQRKSNHMKHVKREGHRLLGIRSMELHVLNNHVETVELWCDQCHKMIRFEGIGCLECNPDGPKET
jgi:hypothetical protein